MEKVIKLTANGCLLKPNKLSTMALVAGTYSEALVCIAERALRLGAFNSELSLFHQFPLPGTAFW